jgi:hypothetical protein
MPREAVRLGAAGRVLPLLGIAAWLLQTGEASDTTASALQAG